MGQEMGAGRDAHVSACSGCSWARARGWGRSVTRRGRAAARAGREGGRRPTAAVQTSFKKHHKTHAHPLCAREVDCAAAAVDGGGLIHPDLIHMLASNGRSGTAHPGASFCLIVGCMTFDPPLHLCALLQRRRCNSRSDLAFGHSLPRPGGETGNII